jgi:ectoine hydroxylase-related dioxygenase (phytanoyl-CoA dioxygenase family)
MGLSGPAERGTQGLTDLERYELDVRGVLVIPGALDAAEVERLRGAVAALGRPPAADDLWSQRINDLLLQGQPFVDLLDHPRALAVLDEVHGPATRLDHAYAIRMEPATSGLGLHGGAVPWDPAQFYVHDGGRPRLGLVTLSWALVDHLPGRGGFGCIPGSHRAGMAVPAGAEELVTEVPVSAGDLLVFSEALAHCTLPWQGPGERLAVLYKYSPGSSAWSDWEQLRPALDLPLTERQRRLLQPPSVGYFTPVW